MFEALGLHKKLGGNAVLSDVSLKVSAGETVALIGPNGAGKSVLLRALCLIDPVDRGTIRFGDLQFNYPCERNPKPPWPVATLLPQHLHLFPHLRLKENLLLPLRHLSRDEAHRRIQSLAASLHLDHLMDRFPHQVSGGERQRAAFARTMALHPTPRWLFLDEPTAALDVKHTLTVGQMIERRRAEGCCVVMSTHLLGLVRRSCTHFLFVVNGRIVEAGPAANLDRPSTKDLAEFVELHSK